MDREGGARLALGHTKFHPEYEQRNQTWDED